MDVLTALQPEGIAQWALAIAFITSISLCTILALNSRNAGLSHIPGPFLARYTDIWAVHFTWKTRRYRNKVGEQRGLRAQYGDAVRTGPRTVTVFDPAAVPVIYGVRSKLDKVKRHQFDEMIELT